MSYSEYTTVDPTEYALQNSMHNSSFQSQKNQTKNYKTPFNRLHKINSNYKVKRSHQILKIFISKGFYQR